MINKKNTQLGINILNQGSKVDSFIKDKKEYTSAKLSETLKNNQKVVTLANAFIDGLPIIGLLKNTPIFLKSLNNNEWKSEIFRLCAILGCMSFEFMSRYSGFVSHDTYRGLHHIIHYQK